MIVTDASALVAALLQTSAAEAVRRHLFAPNQSLHAPHLLDVEVTHVLRRYTKSRELDEERGRGALGTLAAFPIRRYAHDLLLPRVWQLRDNFSAYDGVYVALAEALGASLLTCDRRLASAAGQYVSIALITV
ncbi:type II toxin-antitoxin system VapC family toxin [Reyranella sp.]|uniref:type II toxin-antitoxin system VapC family toxin n=1 Tax=Reyranella sp. TaxID=1929291 RepID=UPI003D1334EA